MKENEKINWGLLLVILGFFCCLKLGIMQDLDGPTQPNNLNKINQTSAIYYRTTCGNELFRSIESNNNSSIYFDVNNNNGNIRRLPRGF